jgi:putative colanic acid biosynthesis acetyltransferase WcaF
MLLRAFGAKVGRGVRVYNSVEFFHPANADLADNVIIGPNVDFYNVARITVEEQAVVSQHTHLCSATHEYCSPNFDLVPKPIIIHRQAWICAGAFVGPGVAIGEFAVVGARAVVNKDIPGWMVVAGNPAQVIKERILNPTEKPKK